MGLMSYTGTGATAKLRTRSIQGVWAFRASVYSDSVQAVIP